MAAQFSNRDLDLMVRTVAGEAANQGPEGMAAVAHVILNRVASGKYGDTPEQVVLAPNQFEPWAARGQELMRMPVNSPAYKAAWQAVDSAVGGAEDPTGGATHFFAPQAQAALGRPAPKWATPDTMTGQVGGHRFYAPEGPTQRAITRALGEGAQPASLETALGYAPNQGTPPVASKTPLSADDKMAASTPDVMSLYFGDVMKDAAPSAPSPVPTPSAAASGEPFDAMKHYFSDMAATPTNGGSQPAAPEGSRTGAAIAGVVEGLPIIGPYAKAGMERGAAAIRSVARDEKYSDALKTIQGDIAADVAAHPNYHTAGEIAGGVAGTVPMMMAAPAAFGVGAGNIALRSVAAGLSGSAIGGADSAVRSGGDLAQTGWGAVVGGVAGGAGPAIGKAAGYAGNKLLNMAAGAPAEAQNVNQLLHMAGMTPAEARTALQSLGPNATLADIHPTFLTDASALAARGGETTGTLKTAMKTRAEGADDRVSQLIDQHLGPKPDAARILDDIRTRERDLSFDPQVARASLDDAMGAAKDPYGTLQTMLKERSTAAQPLYEKALERKVAWDDRLQQFLDDPIVQSGLSKGARIQRLESLSEGKPFNPTDFAIKDFDASGAPIIGTTPNMRTLNVVKKGLDAMVEDSKHPITGKLSEEGRAIDGVRKALLGKMDQINPDYAAARQAWQGPTQMHEAFDKGLNIFQNRSGSSGVNSTPGALETWFNGASAGEKDAIKAGVRAAYEQQMASASDPAAKALALSNKASNQAKLTTILGKDEAQKLVRQMNFKYEDPVGQAFSKGLDIFKARQGIEGIGDTADALRAALPAMSKGEVEAYRQGARQAIEQALTSARNGDASAAQSLFAKSTANRQKLDALFPNAQKLFDSLHAEATMRNTERAITGNSLTAERTAAGKRYSPGTSDNLLADMLAAGQGAAMGDPTGGLAAAAARRGASNIWGNIQNKLLNNMAQGTARGMVAVGPEQQAFLQAVERARGMEATNKLLQMGADYAAPLTIHGTRNKLTGR